MANCLGGQYGGGIDENTASTTIYKKIEADANREISRPANSYSLITVLHFIENSVYNMTYVFIGDSAYSVDGLMHMMSMM